MDYQLVILGLSLSFVSSQNSYDQLTFCRNNETLKIPVYSNQTEVYIPCTTEYYLDAAITLYKGTPKTTLTPVMYSNSSQYSMKYGFLYEIREIINASTSYTCHFSNSTGLNFVSVEIFKADDSISLSPEPDICSLSFYTNTQEQLFTCEGDNQIWKFADIKWNFVYNDGGQPFRKTVNGLTVREIKDGVLKEHNRISFNDTRISGVECIMKTGGLSKAALLPVTVKPVKSPIILDNSVPVLLQDMPGIELVCEIIADPVSSVTVSWLRNNMPVMSAPTYTSFNDENIVTKLTKTEAVFTSDNYTCVAENTDGFDSKSFIVQRKKYDNLHIMLLIACILTGLVSLYAFSRCIKKQMYSVPKKKATSGTNEQKGNFKQMQTV